MTALSKYIFLGIVQGLTEFFPVSSSGHLVIFQELLRVSEHQLLLDIALHLGTLLAIVVFLFKDIRRWLGQPRMLFYLFLVTLSTGLVFLAGGSLFERMFESAGAVSWGLVITGVILLCTRKFNQGQGQRRSEQDLTTADAVYLGIMQGLAIIPGISRSGITVSTLLFRKVDQETAFRYSFLAAIPAILGAVLLKIRDFSFVDAGVLKYMLWGMAASFVTGLLALAALRWFIRRGRLHWFAYYCLLLACVLWIVPLVRVGTGLAPVR